MAISRSQLLKELLPGLNALFGLEYNRYGEEHKEIYEIETSERSFEEEVKLAGFGAAPVKNEGAGITYDSAQEAYVARYTHETIAMGFAITEEAVEDNLYDSLSARYTKALARGMAYTKQVKAAAILNTATSTTYGDGVALLSTAHPLVNGATNSNRPAAHADLNETSLENAIIAMAAWTDEKGLLIAAKPRKLIIPPALMFVAERLIKTPSDMRQGTADRDINAIVQMGSIPEGYAVNHWLTNTTQWFLLTDVPNSLKHFVRAPIKQEMLGDFETGNARYKARERYSFGVSDPLGVYGSA
jgi:phage major head subunit gpT-like protein